jgi:predicted TIM-barrel fold metal-dependent hydrolase
MTDFEVVDCHGHIFPPLAGACGFGSAEAHLVHLQRAMHVHGNQPYRRLRDHAITTERPLWHADDPSEGGRATDVAFRVGRFGRFEWERDGESYYVQFLPPHMEDLSSPPEGMVVQMDYARVGTMVLQNDHIYGNLAEYFAEAARCWPGRFVGLAQIDEPFGYRDDELRSLENQVHGLGMRGLYFTMTGFFRNGYRTLPDDPTFDGLWRTVARLGLPVFWVHAAKSPAGDYLDEMRRLGRIVDRHPAIRHVLVHGVPTGLYANDQDRIVWPDEIAELLDRRPVWTEVLHPIAWGGRMPYPYARAQLHFRQTYDRFGARKLAWGSDMPNVGRYCTYRQSMGYVWDHADYLSPDDRRRIFRENALELLAPSGHPPADRAG